MKISSVSKILALSLALAGTNVFAQSISMPTISSPSMPTIDAPVIGSGYYRPGSYTGSQSSSSTATKKSTESTGSEKKAEEIATAMMEDILPSLTADDIQELNVNGVLETVLESQKKSTVSASTDSDETDQLLRQVLSEMEEIKNQQAQVTKASSSALAASTARPSGSRVLRFKVNGYDILRTCRTLFISDVQSDGTFLITGDRRYQSDGSTRSETFHLLFKAASGAESLESYDAAALVTQDYLNENSFLYQMSQRDDMQASRTGNLVTLRTTDPKWKLELLIDLGRTNR
ncbi:MAG: hypothetical protein IKQ66_00600 [Treponema sp.]|nr:hypothetical protein [Treponema sp.]